MFHFGVIYIPERNIRNYLEEYKYRDWCLAGTNPPFTACKCKWVLIKKQMPSLWYPQSNQWNVLIRLCVPISSKLENKIKLLSICLPQSLLSSTNLFLHQMRYNNDFWHYTANLCSSHLRIGSWPPLHSCILQRLHPEQSLWRIFWMKMLRMKWLMSAEARDEV